MSEFYVITGATGHIGRRAAEALLAGKKKVRVVGRDAGRLTTFTAKGAEAFVGSVEDAAGMTKALSGAKAVFAMIPPKADAADVRANQNQVSEALAAAIRQAKVPYVVSLSSVGAHMGENMGPVNGLHDHEVRFNELDAHVVHLRPTYFMENLLVNVGLIKSAGFMGGALKSDLKMPVIATQDIADALVARLTKLDFKGKSTRELLGQRDIAMSEAAKAIGAAIGRPDLKYVQFSYDDALKAMTQMGLSQDYARLLIEMTQSINDGVWRPTEKRSAANTTPTSIETFAKTVFAPAFAH